MKIIKFKYNGYYKKKFIFTLCLLFSFLMTNCYLNRERNTQIDDPNSKLLNYLLQETDFENNWTQTDISVKQREESPTAQNDRLLQNAHFYITGYYGTEKYYISVFHDLKFFEKSITLKPLEFTSGIQGKTVILNLESMGQYQQVACIRNSDTVACKITNSYGNIVSSIILYGPTSISDLELEKLLNYFLVVIDQRILKK